MLKLINFKDENTDVDYDDYNFASVNNRDRFGQMKAKIMVVLVKVEHSARRRIPVISGFMKIQVENWSQLR